MPSNQSDLFQLAASNLIALEVRYGTVQSGLSGSELADWLEFGRSVAKLGHISINMRGAGLLRFLDLGKHLNVYEVAMEVSAKTGRTADETLRTHLGKYYEKRIAFDTHFVDGNLFRYGALNIGCAGATRYGEFCIVLKTAYIEELMRLAYLKSDSLNEYMEPGPSVNEPAIREDLATHSRRHLLASIKYGKDLLGRVRSQWSELLCNSASYIEAIFVGDLETAHIGLVRISVSDFQRFADLTVECLRENATRAERSVAADFVRLLGTLSSMHVEMETIDA
jgi:hypothetical protein